MTPAPEPSSDPIAFPTVALPGGRATSDAAESTLGLTQPGVMRRNAFTIDVEDWFQTAGFAPFIDPRQWPARSSRIERNVGMLLRLLEAREVRATFFMLGWIAHRHPQLVRDISAAGHELGSRGFEHRHVADQGPAMFRENLLYTKRLLEDLSGRAVIGYRAPDFSISHATPWAHELIASTGHRYSSSVFPIHHDRYGMPGAPRLPFMPRAGLVEIPPATVRIFGTVWPATGGGYFRLYPYRLSAWALRRFNNIDQASAVFYAHPWAIDRQQPRDPSIPWATRLRQTTHLDRTLLRLDRLLQDFSWGPIEEVFASRLGDARPQASAPRLPGPM